MGINGTNETIEIAEVDADVPGLCRPDDMARWNMKLDFSDGTIETYGRKRLIEPSQTLHPCICLFQFPKTEFYDINSDDEKEKDKKTRRRLQPQHQSYPANIKEKELYLQIKKIKIMMKKIRKQKLMMMDKI